ncbi:unnamed protein product [Arctogadus glacialis]
MVETTLMMDLALFCAKSCANVLDQDHLQDSNIGPSLFLARINPEFSKCTAKFQTSKKTNKMVQRKQVPLNPHVAAFIRDFTEFDWQNF